MIAPKPKKIPRILAIKSRSIGDTILLSGSLRLLKEHFPDHHIHALVRSPGGQLLEGLDYVDRVISFTEPENKFERFAYWVRMIRMLREQYYNMILNFHSSFRSALTAKFLRTDLCVANHHELRGRNWFSDVPVPGRGQVKSALDRDLDVLRAIDIQASPQDAMPEIKFQEYEKEQAAQLFKLPKTVRIFLGIGAGRSTKRWPVSHYKDLIQRLSELGNFSFVLTSTPADESWAKELPKSVLKFTGLNLRNSALLLSQCQVYIGNDTGLKHAAVALGLKTFTFFGPEAPLEWHPYDTSKHPYAFIENLDCRTETGKHWCPLSECTQHRHRCMTELTVDSVWDSLKRILNDVS